MELGGMICSVHWKPYPKHAVGTPQPGIGHPLVFKHGNGQFPLREFPTQLDAGLCMDGEAWISDLGPARSGA